MRLTVVIPTREFPSMEWQSGNITIQSLRRQTFQDFAVCLVWDEQKRGAAWARNEGFRQADTELVLFSDDDVDWKPAAFQMLIASLDANPAASYSYGAYRSNWRHPGRTYIVGRQRFDPDLLRRRNYISTMSVIRSGDFPGFDESLRRYQDWDLWLTMLSKGKTGVYCGQILFETRLAAGGITFGSIPMEEARAVITRKHGLN